MYAVAEVYEGHRARAVGSATITSPALSEALAGRVERVGMKVALTSSTSIRRHESTRGRRGGSAARRQNAPPALTVSVAIATE
jgi:hypothetical protein